MAVFFHFVGILCQLLSLAIFLRAIISWFNPIPNPLTVLLERITEPVLAPLRRIVPRAGMLDFTPLVAIILLQLIVYLLP
ncbi:YggT family protein [Chloroflexota bacterium]